MEKLVIGIDVGGTSVRAALARAAGGAVLRTAWAGAGNPRSVPAEVLTERLTACVAPLAEAAGAVGPATGGGPVAAVVAGVAGAEPRNPDDAGTRRAYAALCTALHRGGAGEPPVQVHGDTEIAFAAGPGAPAAGVVVIAGTGASAARIDGRRQTATVDGHGWLLGDEGSAFWIAREALRAALRALDGRGPATELVELLTAATDGAGGAGWGEGGPGERGGSAGASARAGGKDCAGRGEGGLRERGRSAGTSARTSGTDGTGWGAEEGALGERGGSAEAGTLGRRRSAEAAVGGGAGRVPEWDSAAGVRGEGTGGRAAGGPPGDAAARIALVDAGFAGAPVEIARLCPVVVRAAEAGDAVAGAILDEAADRLAEMVAVLAPAPGEPLVTTGGLLAPAGPLLPRFTARMGPYGLRPAPVPDGLAGAVALARAMV